MNNWHIDDKIFKVRVEVREMWALFALLTEGLFHTWYQIEILGSYIKLCIIFYSCQKLTAVWQHRPACVRLKNVTDDHPDLFEL